MLLHNKVVVKQVVYTSPAMKQIQSNIPATDPDDQRIKLLAVIGRQISEILDAQDITEEEIQRDFDAHRRRRRAGE